MLQLALGDPLAMDDHYLVAHGTILNRNSAAGVLTNEQDINLGQPGVQLAAFLVVGPVNGQLSFNTNSLFTYIPNALFAGTDAFRYCVSDGYASSVNIATVTVQVGSATNLPSVFAPRATDWFN